MIEALSAAAVLGLLLGAAIYVGLVKLGRSVESAAVLVSEEIAQRQTDARILRLGMTQLVRVLSSEWLERAFPELPEDRVVPAESVDPRRPSREWEREERQVLSAWMQSDAGLPTDDLGGDFMAAQITEAWESLHHLGGAMPGGEARRVLEEFGVPARFWPTTES